MNRLLLAVFLVTALTLPALAKEKANTVLIHPGETVYARFETKGKKMKLVSTSKVLDESAQVVLSFRADATKPGNILTVENKFPRALFYSAEIRSLTRKLHFPLRTSPVVAGKLAFENVPKEVEELAAFEFKLER